MYNKRKISCFLSENLRAKINIEVYGKVSSTNDMAFAARENTAVLAKRQTAGRGRQGRKFFSGKGGVYISFTRSDVRNLTVRAATAVCRTLEFFGINPSVKWVNDVYVNGKKVCGILSESRTIDGNVKTVTGIGINYNSKIPQDLKDIAGSLKLTESMRSAFVAKLIELFYCDDDYMDYYRAKSAVVGKTVTVGDKKVKAIGIDDEGGLIIDDGGSVFVKRSGEIRIDPSEIF